MSAPATPTVSPAEQARLATDALRAGRDRYAAGQTVEAISLLRRAVELRTAAMGVSDPRTVDATRQLAAALAGAGLLDEAGPLLAAVTAASAEAANRARLRRMGDLEAYARVLVRQRDWAQAEPVLGTLVRNCRAVHGGGAESTLWALSQLGTAWQQLGRTAAAERCWRRLLAQREASGADPVILAALHERLAECAEGQSRRAEALTRRLQASRTRAESVAVADAPRPVDRVAPAAGAPAPTAQARVAGSAAPVTRQPLAPPLPGAPDPRAVHVESAVRIVEPSRRPLVRRLTMAAAAVIVVTGAWTLGARTHAGDPAAAASADSLIADGPTPPPSLGAPSTAVYQP